MTAQQYTVTNQGMGVHAFDQDGIQHEIGGIPHSIED
jgi:hypothetical protein